jgi:MinD-like ATPase involved in chromosome partitioning or flagellar assembly
MISQARITSDTTATVHLPDRTVEITGGNIADIRAQVKQTFIHASIDAGGPIDVVIVEPDIRHHLRVEPNGRISARPADDRPVYGPAPIALLSSTPPLAPAPASARVPETLSASTPDPGHDEEADGLAHADEAEPAPVAEAEPVDADTGDAGALDMEPTRLLPTRRRALPRSETEERTNEREVDPDTLPREGPTHVRQVVPEEGVVPEESQLPAVETAPAPEPAPPLTAPAPASRPVVEPASRPTLQDLQGDGATARADPATRGWQGALARLTRGAVSPRPGRAEREERADTERVRRPVDGPRNIAVVNLKGGAHKTTASLMIAATLGTVRGGSVLAWDNNETRGTLAWRGSAGEHHRSALDLLHDVDRLSDADSRITDLDRYVRPQATRFDILASDEDPGSAASIDAAGFERLDAALSRFYRLKVIDTGNNVRASNWLAGVRSSDQLVIVSTLREDTFNAAAWMIDELRATGLASHVDHAVTILSQSSAQRPDPTLHGRLLQHFGAHTRAIVEVPFEKQFLDGGPLDWNRLHPRTTRAWLRATAEIVDGL